MTPGTVCGSSTRTKSNHTKYRTSKEASMPDEPKTSAGRSYQMGDVGAGARVAQGENISWIEGVASLPGGESLAKQFTALGERIAHDASRDEGTGALAR